MKWERIFESGKTVVFLAISSLAKKRMNSFLELGRRESELVA